MDVCMFLMLQIRLTYDFGMNRIALEVHLDTRHQFEPDQDHKEQTEDIEQVFHSEEKARRLKQVVEHDPGDF